MVTDPARVGRYGGVIRAEARRLADTVERVMQFAPRCRPRRRRRRGRGPAGGRREVDHPRPPRQPRAAIVFEDSGEAGDWCAAIPRGFDPACRTW